MMIPPLADWRVIPDATNDEATTILLQDPVWNSFALADLEPPLRDYSQFALASQEESSERAICLILRHPIIGEVLSPFGSRQGVAAILNYLPLPERPLIQAQELHIPLLQHYYQPETSWKRMLRMAITSTSWRLQTSVSLRPIRQLNVSDLPALKHMYTRYPESGFSADLFPQGLYFGIYAGERIVAAGGTHALVPTHGIAVLGNILTIPEARGKGYATAIIAALVTTLFDQQFSLLVLNVFEDNSSAISIYQRLGFQTHHRLLTGKACTIRV
jgi:GNAT superfamily N-acetyltransferase